MPALVSLSKTLKTIIASLLGWDLKPWVLCYKMRKRIQLHLLRREGVFHRTLLTLHTAIFL